MNRLKMQSPAKRAPALCRFDFHGEFRYHHPCLSSPLAHRSRCRSPSSWAWRLPRTASTGIRRGCPVGTQRPCGKAMTVRAATATVSSQRARPAACVCAHRGNTSSPPVSRPGNQRFSPPLQQLLCRSLGVSIVRSGCPTEPPRESSVPDHTCVFGSSSAAEPARRSLRMTHLPERSRR